MKMRMMMMKKILKMMMSGMTDDQGCPKQSRHYIALVFINLIKL